MFANEWTEELRDKRLDSKCEYEKYENQPGKKELIKVNRSKFVSEIPVHSSITKQLSKSTSIHNAKYISSTGKLFVSTTEGIAVYDYIEDLQKSIKQQNVKIEKEESENSSIEKLTPPKIIHKETGQIYVSPEENKLAVLGSNQLTILSLVDKIA